MVLRGLKYENPHRLVPHQHFEWEARGVIFEFIGMYPREPVLYLNLINSIHAMQGLYPYTDDPYPGAICEVIDGVVTIARASFRIEESSTMPTTDATQRR